jgi:hypothetical protein
MRNTQAIAQRASPQAKFQSRKSWVGHQHLCDLVLAPNIRYVVSVYFVFRESRQLTRSSFFPPTPKPNAAGMNFAILMYGSVIIFALIWFRVKARHVYVGPVEYIRKNI